MTDRVIALELNAPRPHLLQLLAQPEFALVRGGSGTGPFTLAQDGEELRLTRELPGPEDQPAVVETVQIAAAPVDAAVKRQEAVCPTR